MNTNRDRVWVVRGPAWADFIAHVPHEHMEPVGKVKVGSSLEGALFYDRKAEVFVMIKADGAKVDLNQRKVRAALGLSEAAKDPLSRPEGKPRAGYEVRELYSVRLEPSIAEDLRKLGGGNLAEGIMKLARERQAR